MIYTSSWLLDIILKNPTCKHNEFWRYSYLQRHDGAGGRVVIRTGDTVGPRLDSLKALWILHSFKMKPPLRLKIPFATAYRHRLISSKKV